MGTFGCSNSIKTDVEMINTKFRIILSWEGGRGRHREGYARGFRCMMLYSKTYTSLSKMGTIKVCWMNIPCFNFL